MVPSVGEVHQIGFDHVALLVLGTFPVTIPSSSLPHFLRDTETDCWFRESTNETIKVGTKILFSVVE
jgi:hypothetical protein